jgi:hypothetical protein
LHVTLRSRFIINMPMMGNLSGTDSHSMSFLGHWERLSGPVEA